MLNFKGTVAELPEKAMIGDVVLKDWQIYVYTNEWESIEEEMTLKQRIKFFVDNPAYLTDEEVIEGVENIIKEYKERG